MDKRHLRYLAVEEESDSGGEEETIGRGYVRYEASEDYSISALAITGTSEGASCRGVGIKTEDGCKIKLRIHGERMLDGYELERILKERGSPAYGGKIDEDSFRFVVKSDSGHTIIDRTDMFIPSGDITLFAEAYLDAPLPEGKLASGILLSTAEGERAVVFDGEEGSVFLEGSTGSVNAVYGIKTAPLEEERSYAIRYDSLDLLIDGGGSEEAYDGYVEEIVLSDGLYCITNMNMGVVYDYMDLIDGSLTRKCAAVRLGELELSEIYIDSVPCFMAELSTIANTSSGAEGSDIHYYENYDFLDTPESFTLSEDGTRIYIYLGEGVNLSSAKDRLADTVVVYVRSEEVTEYFEPIEDRTIGGTVVIEVCSEVPADIYVIHGT